MTYSTMAQYYALAGFLPTYGRFQTTEDLEKHAAYRRHLLNDLLYLPERLFWRANLIEMGPDTGENALAFAKAGAALTLVEPNKAAHPVLLEYFNKYKLASHLVALYSEDLETFAKRKVLAAFDFCIAEGFVYTVQPSSLWIELFSRLLKPGGMAVISFYEKYGGYVELLTKRAYHRVKELTGWPPLKVAQELFTVKWNTVPHMRSFIQWTCDVLENPFVDARYFLDAEQLCQDFEAQGMRLYSSWPQYRSPEAYWHKLAEKPGRREAWIESQRAKWMYGELPGAEYSLQYLDALVQGDKADAIINFCQRNPEWIQTWGMANNFLVAEKNYV